jgi:hypothetical protein
LGVSGAADGVGINARFNQPNRLAVDSPANLILSNANDVNLKTAAIP